MENYQYNQIENLLQENERKERPWILFLRQLFICTGSWTFMFISGMGQGSATVYIAQLRKEGKSDNAVSDNMSSWLISIAWYSAPIWSLFWTILTKHIGRKIPLALASTVTLLGYILFYLSTNLTYLLISEALKGAGYACNTTIVIFIITEYCSPKYRGLFLTVKAASIFWGMWVSNAIGTFFHWKDIGIAVFICNVYLLTLVFWPESPFWLATKGRFEECIVSHRWLKGTSEASEQELRILLETQKQKYQEGLTKNTSSSLRTHVAKFFKVIARPQFYKPMLITFLVGLMYTFSGKVVCSFYAIQMMKKVMNDEDSAYTVMLVLDGVTVFSMYCGCLLARYLKRRTLYFSTSTLGIVFLYVLSLYFYLIYLNIVTQNGILTIALLTIFSMGISMGPMILSYSLYGELMPTDSRTTYSICGVVLNFLVLASYLKISPYIFNSFSLHVTFLTYAVSGTIFSFLIYFYLPETKDKTLAEIQNYFKKETTLKTRRLIESNT